MKKILFTVLLAVFIFFFTGLLAQKLNYFGANECRTCHEQEEQGRQFPIWKESNHATSFFTLTSEEVKAEVPDAEENPRCLNCHAPLSQEDPELKEEGVTCEVCHGPGSSFKMKSAGGTQKQPGHTCLISYESAEAVQASCRACHESAHGKSFDFNAAWEKIKHFLPEKNEKSLSMKLA